MITDSILSVGGWLLHTLLSALPVVTIPSWMSSNDGAFATVFSAAGSMGVWFPSTLVVTVLGSVLAFWLIGFGIKIVRIVASFFTAGGGSAA